MLKFNDEQVAKLTARIKKDLGAKPNEHLTDKQLLEYAGGGMSEAEQDCLDIHLVACETCTKAVDLMLEAAQAWDAGVGETVLANARPALHGVMSVSTASRSPDSMQLVEKLFAAIHEAITPRRVKFALGTAPVSNWEEKVAAVGDLPYACRRGEDAVEFYFYTPAEDFINTTYTIEIGSEGRSGWEWQSEIKFLLCDTVPGMKASALLRIDREERLEWPDDAKVSEVTRTKGE